MTPRILLSYSAEGGKSYEAAVRAAGGLPEGGYCPAADVNCDGLLLCGGTDVDPSRFGQENHGSEGIDLQRDEAEIRLIQAFLTAKKPILGICRGLQIINVALGGTLIQDISPQLRAFHTHERGSEADKIHPVLAAEDSFFGRTFGKNFSVNSSHHQAVDSLGSGLQPVLWSESGVIEGLEHDSLPILCVQFHPERMSYENCRRDTVDGSPIFERFMKMCGA